jgi:hypothetical protein
MSLTVADTEGKMLAHSYGSEYQEEYMESAAVVRERAGLLAALLLGVEEQYDQVFGKTEAVVKLHKNASLVVLPSPSRTMIFTILTKTDMSARELLPRIRPLLEDL